MDLAPTDWKMTFSLPTTCTMAHTHHDWALLQTTLKTTQTAVLFSPLETTGYLLSQGSRPSKTGPQLPHVQEERFPLGVVFSEPFFESHGECDSNESSCDAWTTG